jgi:PPM family protein phosphatase
VLTGSWSVKVSKAFVRLGTHEREANHVSHAKQGLGNCEESTAVQRDSDVRVDVGARSDTGRVREGNEDRFKLIPERNLFVLSDGMGGQASGEVASYMAVEAVAAHFQDADSDPSLPLVGPPVVGLSEKTNRLASAVRLANHVIYESAQENPERRGMGATIVAVQFDDLRMSLAHVGDSRVYCLRSGEIERLTQDHSLVAEQVRHGMLSEYEAEKSAMQSVLLRALGMEPETPVDADERLLIDGDAILLCSDGLTRMVTDEEIAATLLEYPVAQEAAEQLVDRANEAGGEDNITVIVLRLAIRSQSSFARLGRWLKGSENQSPYKGGR